MCHDRILPETRKGKGAGSAAEPPPCCAARPRFRLRTRAPALGPRPSPAYPDVRCLEQAGHAPAEGSTRPKFRGPEKSGGFTWVVEGTKKHRSSYPDLLSTEQICGSHILVGVDWCLLSWKMTSGGSTHFRQKCPIAANEWDHILTFIQHIIPPKNFDPILNHKKYTDVTLSNLYSHLPVRARPEQPVRVLQYVRKFVDVGPPRGRV